MMVDTVGLYLLGLPDIQYHFHSLNPNKVMKHAYSVASLLYSVGAVMKSGETIDGDGQLWHQSGNPLAVPV